MDDAERKDALLMAVLPDVAFDGWTRPMMRVAAERMDMGDVELNALFPQGPRDAVAWFSRWADLQAVVALEAAPAGLRAHERIALVVKARLAALMPYREAVRRAAALLALPSNLPLAAKLLYASVDTIWYAAGDNATDFNFYTKRGLLAAIYAATSLYWLDDRSEDAVATAAFLDRRLAEIAVIPRMKSRVERALGQLPNPVRLLHLRRVPS